jgi:hypothetical protein
MGDSNKPGNSSRRSFLAAFTSPGRRQKAETIKMLTPDGKLVEVDKNIVAAATNRSKANNEAILQWMENPSKKEE